MTIPPESQRRMKRAELSLVPLVAAAVFRQPPGFFVTADLGLVLEAREDIRAIKSLDRLSGKRTA